MLVLTFVVGVCVRACMYVGVCVCVCEVEVMMVCC